MSEPPPRAGTGAATGGGNGFLGAVQFLTRVPVRLRTAADPARSMRWFPVVGALVGAACGAVAAGTGELVPSTVAAMLAIATGLLATGAFHEDGLADVADALGGWSPAQRREIMKDSRHGTYGVAAMSTSIVLRVLCVATLAPAAALAGLVAAHSLGRGAAVAVAGWAPRRPHDPPDGPREPDGPLEPGGPAGGGLGADHVRSVTHAAATTATALAVVIAAVATGWWAGPLVLATTFGALAVTALAVRAFEQVSGDVLGAVEQVAECLVLVVVTGLAAHHSVWWTSW